MGLKCRDPEYIKITTQFALDVTKDAMMLHAVPSILRPIAARLFGYLEAATRSTMKHVGSLIQYRLEMDDKYGQDSPNGDRPNDMISWLLDEAHNHPSRNLTRTLLNVNFGAIHTTTQGFLHALHNLAANLEYVEPLREEIEHVVKPEGWTEFAMSKMVKLDSIMKESSRFVPGGAVKDFTLPDGTTVSAGTLVGVPVLAEHHEESCSLDLGCVALGQLHKHYRVRPVPLREDAGEGIKHQMVTPSSDFLTFGIGRHGCPGRFFAVNEQKLIMAHVIMTYNFKLKDRVLPQDEWVAVVGSANSTAECGGACDVMRVSLNIWRLEGPVPNPCWFFGSGQSLYNALRYLPSDGEPRPLYHTPTKPWVAYRIGSGSFIGHVQLDIHMYFDDCLTRRVARKDFVHCQRLRNSVLTWDWPERKSPKLSMRCRVPVKAPQVFPGHDTKLRWRESSKDGEETSFSNRRLQDRWDQVALPAAQHQRHIDTAGGRAAVGGRIT
ncbi:cytochrome P450 [Mycena vulgaris]|nr:cytochrome P450 [Mycena vulgaris]